MNMTLILYNISHEVDNLMSFYALILSSIGIVISLVAIRPQCAHSSKDSRGVSKRQLIAVMVICVVIMVSALFLLVSQMFFDFTKMEPKEVPSVEGTPYMEAVSKIQSEGFWEKVICDDNSEDWGNYVVIEQKPAGGEIALTKTKVKLFLAPAETHPEGSDTQDENTADTPLLLSNIALNADPEFSDASITPSRAYSGDNVELHICGIDYYEFDLTLIDKNGNKLSYEREDWLIFTFIMPDCDVTVYLNKAEPIPPMPTDVVEPETTCSYGLECPTRGFSDLDPNAWYHEAADFVVKNNLLNGYSDVFNPNGTLTRAEASVLFCKMAGWPTVTVDNNFSDVSDAAWYAIPVKWATNQGIIDSYNDGTFQPDNLVTMEQFLTILWRYAGFPHDPQPYLAFSDEAEISQYAMDAVDWAAGQQFLQFTNSVLNPQKNITRIEIAEILKNFIEVR